MPATGMAGVDGQLRAAAREDGDAVFVSGEAGSLTYAALDARVDGLAAALCARGIAPGDRVAIAAPNGVGNCLGF